VWRREVTLRPAGLAAEVLDEGPLAVAAITDEGVHVGIGDAEVGAIGVGTGEAGGVAGLRAATAALEWGIGEDRGGCSGCGCGRSVSAVRTIVRRARS